MEKTLEYASTLAPTVIAENLRKVIMMHITYPRMARRMDWQGMASFDLSVRSRQLASLDLRQSTGHEILDQAAIKGIHQVKHFLLDEGIYQSPVEFRSR